MPTSSESQPLDSIGTVAEAFREAMVESIDAPTAPPNPVTDLLTDHLGVDPETLEALTDTYEGYLRINFQAALDEFLGEKGVTHRAIGIHCPSIKPGMGPLSLSLLLTHTTLAWAPVEFMPAEYDVLRSGCDSTMACISQAMVLFEEKAGKGVMFVRGGAVDMMHTSAERATALLAQLRERSVVLSPYRGQVITIGPGRQINFQRRPEHTAADQVVLPAGLLEEIEEHSINVVKARETLEASKRHMKRGILLHGKPGTGKTHTIRYLISQLPEATIAIMSGARMASRNLEGTMSLEMIRKVVDVIVPGIIVLDDVDFIAEDRSLPGQTTDRDALFALLELLDGLGEDLDLMFILTTNRPNMLEPAVAARPGRIDAAIEVPLPDVDCRRRLLDLYGRDLTLDVSDADMAKFLERTDGVTASFVREVVRRAAAEYVLEDGPEGAGAVVVTGAALHKAIDELLDPDKPLSAVLLGAEPEHARLTLAQITTPE